MGGRWKDGEERSLVGELVSLPDHPTGDVVAEAWRRHDARYPGRGAGAAYTYLSRRDTSAYADRMEAFRLFVRRTQREERAAGRSRGAPREPTPRPRPLTIEYDEFGPITPEEVPELAPRGPDPEAGDVPTPGEEVHLAEVFSRPNRAPSPDQPEPPLPPAPPRSCAELVAEIRAVLALRARFPRATTPEGCLAEIAEILA